MSKEPVEGCDGGCCGEAPAAVVPTEQMQRRGFLKLGLASVCAGAGALATASLSSAGGTGTGKKDAPNAWCGDGRLPALSTDGKLIDPVTGEVVVRSPDYHTDEGWQEVREGVPNRRWIMVIDLAECDGCEKCTAACAKYHKTPPDRQWIRVFKMRNTPEQDPYWFPKPCFHCDDPPCTRVCPVDATFKRQDGIVLIDNERCIGCRFCMAACPYSTRFFNWGHPEPSADSPAYTPESGTPKRVGTVEKCDFCPDMLRQGMLPHCATSCTMGAIMFGDENEDAVTDYKGRTHRLSKLLKDRAGYRYLEELGTKPRVYYLPAKNPTYDPPKFDDSEEPLKTS